MSPTPPTDEDLGTLINSFVRCKHPVEIGTLRYTETPSPGNPVSVPILIDPRDIVGEPTAAQRLANFGKTRFGKSNSNKILAQAIFESGLDVAQVFLDPSGEYTYINDQDGTSLYSQYSAVRAVFTTRQRLFATTSASSGLRNLDCLPSTSTVLHRWGTSSSTPCGIRKNRALPGYWRPVLDWNPTDPAAVPTRRQDASAFNHHWRTLGMWYALLHRADFTTAPGATAPITFTANVKADLVQNVQGVSTNQDGRFDERGQPITALGRIYQRVATLHSRHGNDSDWFPDGQDGTPYFSDSEVKLLQMLSDSSIVAHNYIRPFNKYHSHRGGSIFEEIANHIANDMSVFIDISQSNELVRNNLVDRICRAVFHEQNSASTPRRALAIDS